jgi:phage terminase large subunit GpA-like protein
MENNHVKIQINQMLDSTESYLSDVLPSEWAESNRVMSSDVSSQSGKFSFDYTPYLREVVDTMSPNHPARIVAVMKGAQIGFSTGVIENAIGFIISQAPGNILFLTGHADLAGEAMNGKIDQMIESTGLRKSIRPNVIKKKNQRTGDTAKSKEFAGGSLTAGSAGNHKLLRQRSVKYGFIDDFDAAKKSTKESGSTTEMIEQRFAAYYDYGMKLYYISTPEVKQTSNIEPVYELGDKRKFHVPCPCCGDYIDLRWTFKQDGKEAGITYKIDENGKLIDGTVGYTCQSCFGFFKDNKKQEMLLAGEWKPTAVPSEEGYFSYHLSALYAPVGMYDWERYVRQYLKANPINAPQKTKEMQTFTNLVLGETFEETGKEINSNQLQKNTREYQIKTLPERMSETDGNGKIVLLTCACDLNGVVEDARLDYEVLAWTENGSSYSIDAGSIGTFIPNQTKKQKEATDREKWTYRNNETGNVWDEYNKILDIVYETDTGRKMKVFITGVDTGHYTSYAYDFCESTPHYVLALKGENEDSFRKYGKDAPLFKKGRAKNYLYLVDVNKVKDNLSEDIELHWKNDGETSQPSGFMNFPLPENGKYTFKHYYEHYEAETRVTEVDSSGDQIGARWTNSKRKQNHFWDVRVYNVALKEILTSMVCKELKIKDFTWNDYVNALLGKR